VKAHITLVNPPQTSGAPESGFIPLGIGYLAAVLEEDGYAVDVIDLQVQQHTKRELEIELARLQPDISGITSTTLTYKSATEIVKTAKESCPDSLTILGGPHVTVLDEQTLSEQPEVDIVVRGEGEQTILELADLASKANLRDPKMENKLYERVEDFVTYVKTEDFDYELVSKIQKRFHMTFNRSPKRILKKIRKEGLLSVLGKGFRYMGH